MFALSKFETPKRLVSVIFAWIVCALTCFAPAGLAQGPLQVVDAQIVMASDGAHSGSSQKAAIVANVAAGYHINAHKPSFDYLIPTEVKFENGHAAAVEKTMYPAGKPQKFSFSNDPLSVYQGKFLIGLVLKIPAGIAPGVYVMKGTLNYQACNDRACFAPSRVPLALTIKVVPANMPLKPQNPAVFRELRAAQTD